MSNFTEGLKRAADANAQAIQAQNEIRLHNARVIRASASEFWSQTEQIIRNECDEMRREFPNDRLRNPFVNNYAGFTLNTTAMPRKILAARLDVDGLCVRTDEGVKHSLEHMPMLTPTGPITITVGPEEQLQFMFRGRKYDAPENLAHALISYVCEL